MSYRLERARFRLVIIAVLAMILSQVALTAPQARADHINPTGTVGSNCVEFQAGETGTKSPSDYPNVSVTLDSWDNTPGDPHEATFTVAGLAGHQAIDVSLKSGNLIEEDGPYFNGTHTVMTLGQNAISHIRACVFEAEVGKIIVKKEVTEGSDTTVVFTFNGDFIDGDLLLADGEQEVYDVLAGTYSVSEVVPEGWSLESAICTSTDEGDDSTPGAINVSDNEIVTCTFTNDEIPPEPGRIIVVKEVTDGSDTGQSFDFSASYDGDGFSLADGESNDSGDLDAGVYSVSETVPEGWSLLSASCDDESSVDAIDLAAGETVTCTFTNDEIPPEPGRIIVVKEVTDGSDTGQSFDFSASYDGDGFSLADGESNDSGDLDAGVYSVSETVPEGWSLLSASCDDESSVDAIDLAAGETVTCTFTNDEIPPEPGRIIVVKEVTDGSDTGQSFDFSASYDGDGFSLADGESNDSGDLDAGVYSVSETVPEGWSLLSASCDDESSVDAIDLAAGETVTCTFTNLQDEVLASIVVDVTSVCDPDNDEQGIINVTISVADGATVVITDSNDDVVATFTESGSVTVPDNANYDWEATPSEGFEFPPGSDISGTLAIQDCLEVLPFTGIDSPILIAIALLLVSLGSGVIWVARPTKN